MNVQLRRIGASAALALALNDCQSRDVQPPVIAALITSSVTLLSVLVAAWTLRRQFVKDREERREASEARSTEANKQARLTKEATDARTLADKQRVEAIERTERHRAEDADRRERARAYSDFLVAESARSDAFDRYATIRNELKQTPFKKDTPEEQARVAEIHKRLEVASGEIDRTRHAAWAPLAAMRLVASDEVLRAADDCDKALAASNPRRVRMVPVRLEFGVKKALVEAFVTAARADLGRAPVQAEALVSVDEPSEPDQDHGSSK